MNRGSRSIDIIVFVEKSVAPASIITAEHKTCDTDTVQWQHWHQASISVTGMIVWSDFARKPIYLALYMATVIAVVTIGRPDLALTGARCPKGTPAVE